MQDIVSAAGNVWWALRRDRVTMAGLACVILLAVVATLWPILVPYDPYATDPDHTSEAPSLAHPFGTDQWGQDLLSRVLAGTRIDLSIAAGAVLIASTAGLVLGAWAGYAGGRWDQAIMRAMDVFQAIPDFVLAMGIAAALGPELQNVIIAIGMVNIPTYARLVRSKILSLKASQFAMAAVSAGNSPGRVLLIHLLPNTIGPVLVQATLQSGWAILSAAGLSFIGLGVRLPAPEWGVMVSVGVRRLLAGEWWISFFPGAAIAIAVMAFNLLGDGLSDFLDPKRGR